MTVELAQEMFEGKLKHCLFFVFLSTAINLVRVQRFPGDPRVGILVDATDSFIHPLIRTEAAKQKHGSDVFVSY